MARTESISATEFLETWNSIHWRLQWNNELWDKIDEASFEREPYLSEVSSWQNGMENVLNASRAKSLTAAENPGTGIITALQTD